MKFKLFVVTRLAKINSIYLLLSLPIFILVIRLLLYDKKHCELIKLKLLIDKEKLRGKSFSQNNWKLKFGSQIKKYESNTASIIVSRSLFFVCFFYNGFLFLICKFEPASIPIGFNISQRMVTWFVRLFFQLWWLLMRFILFSLVNFFPPFKSTNYNWFD